MKSYSRFLVPSAVIFASNAAFAEGGPTVDTSLIAGLAATVATFYGAIIAVRVLRKAWGMASGMFK